MEKQRWEESGRRREAVKRSERRKSEKKEEAGARKGREVAIHCVFRMICGSTWSTSRLAKAAGAAPCGQMRDKKLHAIAARSTFPTQNVQSTPFSDHFWKFRCRKSARRCGAKRVSKSKRTKHTVLGPLFDVQMLKTCTPLWREAHFQVKMHKAPHVRTTFDGWAVVLLGRGKGLFLAVSTTTTNTLHYNTLHYARLGYITLHSSTLH